MSASRILTGDCLSILPTLPDKCVHCCVTSPPYFGLRDYGHDGQIGLEPTPDEYVSKMVQVFREVHRVLRDDGTLWLNLGDSYNSPGPSNHGKSKEVHRGTGVDAWTQGIATKRVKGLKPKDLIGIPWRVAFALQADGWYLRQDIIWHKPNPMPESVTDRCTKAHEYVFLLSKSERYFFDSEAMREDAVKGASGSSFNTGKTAEHQLGRSSDAERVDDGKRNRRSVWTVATRPYNGAHFATFPTELILPCVLAGCPAGGTVLDPFNGAGTSGLVALSNGRNYVGIELNPEYVALSMERMGVLSSLIEVTA
jgi:site-specific DNA-methyltransferase (adenine-specific)